MWVAGTLPYLSHPLCLQVSLSRELDEGGAGLEATHCTRRGGHLSDGLVGGQLTAPTLSQISTEGLREGKERGQGLTACTLQSWASNSNGRNGWGWRNPQASQKGRQGGEKAGSRGKAKASVRGGALLPGAQDWIRCRGELKPPCQEGPRQSRDPRSGARKEGLQSSGPRTQGGGGEVFVYSFEKSSDRGEGR